MIEEMKAQILDLLDGWDEKVELTEKGGSYFLKIENMYNYIEFKEGSTLVNYMKIASILGCTDGEEIDRDFYSGCETCDYGSKYTIEMRFW